MPSLKMSASYGGAFSSLTLFGPPEIMMALYALNLLASVSSGNKSDSTFSSRTRRSITYHHHHHHANVKFKKDVIETKNTFVKN